MARFLPKIPSPPTLLLLTGLIAWAAAGCSGDPVPGPAPGNAEPMVIISDFHFNPFYDPDLFFDLVDAPAAQWAGIFQGSSITKPQSWGKETNYPLLVLALDAAGREAGGSPLVLFPGDILGHKFNETFYNLYGKEDMEALRSFIYKTVTFFAGEVRKRFGETPVLFVLGNNDSYTGDYSLVPGGAFLEDTAPEFYDTFLLGGADPLEYFETYTDGGYYAAEPPGSPVRLICLNTVLFSSHGPGNEGQDAVAQRQLNWLEETLAETSAHDGRAWLLMHIPPGADIYATVSTYMDDTGHISDAVTMWKAEYQERFLEITGRYEDVIQATFSGHSHMDEYRLSCLQSDGVPAAVVSTPAISPIFGNNPAFKVLSLNAGDWQLLDYRAMNYDFDDPDPAFRPFYLFSQAYDTAMPLQPALATLYPELALDEVRRQAYEHFYYSGHDAASKINDTTWPAYWCGVSTMDREGYVECVNGYR